MRRGDVVTVTLGETAPTGEAARTRPAIVISNSAHASQVALGGRGTLVVVPITSNVARVFPFQLGLNEEDTLAAMGLTAPSKAQVEQMLSVSIARVRDVRGRTPVRTAWELDERIKLHLSLA